MRKIELLEYLASPLVWDLDKIKKQLTGGQFCYMTRNPSIVAFTNGKRQLGILDGVSEDGKTLRFRIAELRGTYDDNKPDDELSPGILCVADIDRLSVELILEKLEDGSLINIEDLIRSGKVYCWNDALEIGRSYRIYNIGTKDWVDCILTNIKEDKIRFMFFDKDEKRWFDYDIPKNYADEYEVYEHENKCIVKGDE